jgi:small conductance mechanosensitive channel
MLEFFNQHTESIQRIGLILIILLLSHLAVRLVRIVSEYMMVRFMGRSYSKVRTVTSLATSAIIFLLYFSVIGFVLTELGVSLGAYLASASIIGLAVAFGSQGIVQDMVTGLTVVLADQFDVGDMVQIGNQIGVVQRIGVRFTMLQNAMGASVLVPNRAIVSVINYPRGYVRMQADVTLPNDEAKVAAIIAVVTAVVDSVIEQYAAIFRAPPEIVGVMKTASGKSYFRVKFRIWPGRGVPIEAAFKQELSQTLKQIDDTYADWMIAVNYELESAHMGVWPAKAS